MAVLHQLSSGVRHELGSAHLVGRSRNCRLRLQEDAVSGEHASIRWTGRGWQVRDLGSRNGTWVEGHRLEPGQPVALLKGMRVAFGRREEAWELEDDGPPEPRGLCGDLEVVGEDGLLALPDAEEPLACVHQGELGVWVAEVGDEVAVVRDGGRLLLGDQEWELELPETFTETRKHEPPLGELRLELRVSQDEEHIELRLHQGAELTVVDHRSFSYLVLTLARARLEAAELVEAEQGWLYADELATSLGMQRTQFNMAVFRARQTLQRLGLATDLFERRTGSGQVRLAVAEVSVGSF